MVVAQNGAHHTHVGSGGVATEGVHMSLFQQRRPGKICDGLSVLNNRPERPLSQPPPRPGEVEFPFATPCRARAGLGMLSSCGAAGLLLAPRWLRRCRARGWRGVHPAVPAAAAGRPGGQAFAGPERLGPRLATVPRTRNLLLFFLSPSRREVKLLLASVRRRTDRSANPSRGPAKESRRPENPRRWLSLTVLCLKWGRGRVSPPPLNANTMRRAISFPALCLLLNLHAAGCFSGNNDHFLAINQKKSGKPIFVYHHSQDIEKSLDIAPQKIYKHSYHSSSEAQVSKRHQIVNSAFPRPAYDPSLNLLAMAGQDLEVENLPIPAANIIVVGEFPVYTYKLLSASTIIVHRLPPTTDDAFLEGSEHLESPKICFHSLQS
ncbi:uncharacterized protein LOC123640528 [Lemur catta]|uniref:uncharacterized protein LOC123640528 n=1 Tax=Lemur catta TaxID=9447 RepID=UPI001E26B94A|nr:uncharacterized protein LOC123640528 [Lemur catta]